MPAIWGHVESVVNQPTSPPSLRLNTRTPSGTRRTECIVVDMPAKQPAVMATSPISDGLRVAVEPFEYSRLQKFKLGVRSHLWGGECSFEVAGGSSSETATQNKQTHAASSEGGAIYSDAYGPRVLIVANDTRVRSLLSVLITHEGCQCV
jgi:hypothetical protein